MASQLNAELAAALHAAGDNELEVVDPRTARTYVLVDRETHRQAMEALRQKQDRDSIAQGLAQMEAGQGKPLDQAFDDMRERLNFPRTS